MTPSDSQPEAVARDFVDALNLGCWRDAAALVAPSTLDAFRRSWLGWLRAEGSRSTRALDQDPDTVFADPLSLLQLGSVDEAERLHPVDLLARFIERVQPGSFAAGARRGPDRSLRVTRTIVGLARSEGGSAVVDYQVVWDVGGDSHPGLRGVHQIHLRLTPEGWRVEDADVGGQGTGHLIPLDQSSPGSGDQLGDG